MPIALWYGPLCNPTIGGCGRRRALPGPLRGHAMEWMAGRPGRGRCGGARSCMRASARQPGSPPSSRRIAAYPLQTTKPGPGSRPARSGAEARRRARRLPG